MPAIPPARMGISQGSWKKTTIQPETDGCGGLRLRLFEVVCKASVLADLEMPSRLRPIGR